MTKKTKVDEKEEEESQVDTEKLMQQTKVLQEQIEAEKTKNLLKSNGEYRYYLLNNLVNINNSLTDQNESLKKIGLTLVEIGKCLDKGE